MDILRQPRTMSGNDTVFMCVRLMRGYRVSLKLNKQCVFSGKIKFRDSIGNTDINFIS